MLKQKDIPKPSLQILRQRLGLAIEDESKDEVIFSMTALERFKELVSWHIGACMVPTIMQSARDSGLKFQGNGSLESKNSIELNCKCCGRTFDSEDDNLSIGDDCPSEDCPSNEKVFGRPT